MTDTDEALNPRTARFTKRSVSMPDLRLPEAWGRSSGRTTKRKRLDTDFDIAVDTDDQVEHFKRQNSENDHDNIDLTPSHRIPDVLYSESAPQISRGEPQPSQLPASLVRAETSQPITSRQSRSPQSSTLLSEPGLFKQSTLLPEPQTSQRSTLTTESQSSNLLISSSTRPYSISQPKAPSADKQLDKRNDRSKAIQKWEPSEWDENEFDSDDENMSLAVTMKLANELSLLKSFLEIYRKFNIHLGDIVSGPRHKGFLSLITFTVASLESHSTRLRILRDEQQRGNPTRGNMELIAERISRKIRSRRSHLRDVMEEKVDMTNDTERAIWVKKKKSLLGDVMGGLVGYLEELGEEEGWKGREVREMGERWEKRWKAYGAMDKQDLKNAGWILDVGKRDG